MFKTAIRTAGRRLLKQGSSTWLNISGLSIGMTAAVLIFLWVQNEMTYDAYHPQADRIYRVTSGAWTTSPLPLAAAIRQEIPEAEKVAVITPAYSINFRIRNEFFPEKTGAYIDGDWFRIFHYDFIEGDPDDFLRHPYSLLITESKARKYFGQKSALGETIRIDSNDYKVRAVVKDIPANSSFRFDVLMPLAAYLADSAEKANDMTWNNFNYLDFIKLRPGADPRKVAGAVTNVMKEHVPKSTTDMKLLPLKEMHFEKGLTSSEIVEHTDRRPVYIFSVLGVFLLVIACINYVNLTTARASGRAREVSIRKIAGARKSSLFGQFLLESAMITGLALLITLVLIRLSLPFFRNLTGKGFTDPLLSPVTWEILGGTGAAAIILNGIYPALLLSSFQPLKVFKGNSILTIKDAWFRKGLVVLQFTFSVILIICTIIIQQQLHYIQNMDPGYDRAQVFSFYFPRPSGPKTTDEEKEARLGSIRQELMSHTSIEGVTTASKSIVNVSNTNTGSAHWDGQAPGFMPVVSQLSADEEYNKVLGIQLQQGRWFQPGDATDRHNFILNETAVREFNMRKPILGQRFIFQRDTGQIIGIAKDIHIASLHNKIGPLVILNNVSWRNTFFVKTRPGKTPEALAAARNLWKQYYPYKPFEYSFLDDQFDNLYKSDSKLSSLILLFSAIAIGISCLGLLGLAAFTAEQRTKEIGIRKVLGATVTGILVLLSGDFVRLVLLSILIAIPVAGWAMHQWLEDFAYHITPGPFIFAGAGALALLIAVLTIGSQSVRAARSNPVKNLRTE